MPETQNDLGWLAFADALARLPASEREQQWSSLTQDQRAALLFHTRKFAVGPLASSLVVAGLPVRFVAWSLDLALCSTLLVAGTAFASRQPAITYSACALAIGYFFFSDALPNGQSIGKRICGIRVVDWATGKPCTVRQALLRSIAHFAGIFDWLAALRDTRRRGGDELAATAVVKARIAPAVAAA